MHHFNDPEQYFDEYKRTYKLADRREDIPYGNVKDADVEKQNSCLRTGHKKRYSAAGTTYGGNE